MVLVAAAQIGLSGIESKLSKQIGKPRTNSKRSGVRRRWSPELRKTAEDATRKSQAVPKIACVSVPQTYIASSGQEVNADAIDLTVRIMSMGTLHGSIAVSVAIATAGAVMIPGTVPFNLKGTAVAKGAAIHLGHPGGIVDVEASIEMRSGEPHYVEAAVGRTARRLMEGYALVPERCFR